MERSVTLKSALSLFLFPFFFNPGNCSVTLTGIDLYADAVSVALRCSNKC